MARYKFYIVLYCIVLYYYRRIFQKSRISKVSGPGNWPIEILSYWRACLSASAHELRDVSLVSEPTQTSSGRSTHSLAAD